MPAKILIRRTFSQGMTPEIAELLNKLRAAALKQPGYITGMTLANPENPRDTLVISTWENIDRWRDWKNHPERQSLEAALALHVEGVSKYEEYVTK